MKAQDNGYKISDVFQDMFCKISYGAIPEWPPDVFCFAAAVLHQSGAYTKVSSKLNLDQDFPASSTREEGLAEIAGEWKISQRIPPQVTKWWNIVRKAKQIPLRSIVQDARVTGALINLIAVADEVCKGVGMSYDNDPFLFDVEMVLLLSDNITLCKEVDPSRYAVLPKMHTAQSGLTIRSFSHHLAFLHCREMTAQWHLPFTKPALFEKSPNSHAFNLLIVPWPKEVQPSQFIASERVKLTDEVERGSYGLFRITPPKPPTVSFVDKMLKAANRRVGEIDGIIMPELSLTEKAFQQISARVVTPERFFLAGVGSADRQLNKEGENYLCFDLAVPGGEFVFSLEQRKHHRWKLTKSQILQYGIGTNLHPEANWWEHISIEERNLLFVNLRPWLTITPLICEDLARPEPVGDIVRAIGPNLLIALLMDAPQLNGRWPGRYAASLADDPGCSVLTVTSSGMSRLSKTRNEKDRSDVVALWRDPKTGTQELELSKEADGIVLTITVEYGEEWTADGRGDKGTSGFPILAGHHMISLK
jgi:hypothetical protein